MQPEPESEQPELVKPAPGQLRAPLRCRIESDPAVMQALHERYRWVPGAESIRPNPDVLEKKKAYQANTERFYASDVDCVLDLVFDCPTSCAAPSAPRLPRSPSARAHAQSGSHFHCMLCPLAGSGQTARCTCLRVPSLRVVSSNRTSFHTASPPVAGITFFGMLVRVPVPRRKIR